MKEIEINKENLIKLFDNLRKDDLYELKATFKNNIKRNFVKICLENKDTYFIADDNGSPLAIGGIKIFYIKNFLVGQVWLLCSNDVSKNRLSVLKYVKDKIDEFKLECDILFNFIYKSNFNFLKWLQHAEFEAVPVNKNFKLFYYKKGGIDFDLRYFTCK